MLSRILCLLDTSDAWNLAYGQPAWISSLTTESCLYAVNWDVDSTPDAANCAQTEADDVTPTFVVELMQDTYIDYVEILMPADCCGKIYIPLNSDYNHYH